MGYRLQLPEEDFHAYMSRLYREQGMPGAKAPISRRGSHSRSTPSSGNSLSKQASHSTGIQYASSNSSKPQGTMLNITAVGRLGKDPELRTTQKGQEITSFSLAVNVFAKGEQRRSG